MWLSPLAGALVVGTAAWLATGGSHGPGALGGTVPIVLAAVCGLAFASAGVLVLAGWDGLAFGSSALGIVAVLAAVFTALFPRVMVSSGPGPSLTIWSAASAHQTLLVMTVVAAIFVPFVLAYQGWSYWVFRQRLIRPAGAPRPFLPVGRAAAPRIGLLAVDGAGAIVVGRLASSPPVGRARCLPRLPVQARGLLPPSSGGWSPWPGRG